MKFHNIPKGHVCIAKAGECMQCGKRYMASMLLSNSEHEKTDGNTHYMSKVPCPECGGVVIGKGLLKDWERVI